MDVAANVRQIGKKTFYRKDNRWIDSEVKPEDEVKAKVIEQFSDLYFELAKKQSAELNQYLSFEEPVTVNLGGTIYRIERPEDAVNSAVSRVSGGVFARRGADPSEARIEDQSRS